MRLQVAPSRERGSKHERADVFELPLVSLPHGSADRNVSSPLWRAPRRRPVAPSRERGSKRVLPGLKGQKGDVAPSRERGSKRGKGALALLIDGRSLTGARIETRAMTGTLTRSTRRSLTGARIETFVEQQAAAEHNRRSLTGARIETASACRPCRVPGRSLPHGSADRNVGERVHVAVRHRRSLTGARIETLIVPSRLVA